MRNLLELILILSSNQKRIRHSLFFILALFFVQEEEKSFEHVFSTSIIWNTFRLLLLHSKSPSKATFLFFTSPLRCLLLPPTKCRLSGEKDVKCIKSYTNSSFWAYDRTHADAFTFANKLSKRDDSSCLLIRKTCIYDKNFIYVGK